MQTIDPGVLSVQPEHAYGGEPRDPLDMVPFDLATPDTAPDEMQGAAARRVSAAVGVPDPDGRIWQGRPFASGAAYLDYMRGLLKSGDIWEYVASDELKAFEAADDAGRVKIAREAMGFVDRAAEAAGRRVPEGYGFADGAPELRGAGEDVLAANARLRGDAEAAARHNARAASFAGDFRPLPEREGASADRETMKAWRRQRGDAELVGEYREKLMRENLAVAWLSVEPALSPRAKEIAAGVFRDGKLRPSDIADFQRLPEDDQRAVARLARLSRNPAAGTFWNTLGDAGIGFFNGVVQLPVNAYKQIGTLTTSIDQSVFGKDAGLVDSAEMNRRARTEQLLREALDDPAGVNPMTTEHGYLARSLIGAVSTLPYMAYASAGAPGFAAVMADFMQRLDDEVAAGGGDVYGRGAEWQARKLLYGAMYAGIERVSALPVWRNAGDVAAKTMFIRLASRLDDEAVARVAAHIGKQTLAETLEESAQAVIESHAKSVGLDRGDGWAAAARDGVKEFGETFGTMALVSGFGAARQGFRAASPRGRADLAEYTAASLRRAGFILSDNPYAGRGTKQAVEDSWGAAAHVMDGYRQTWSDGGIDALKKRTDITEEQAAVLDHVFAAEREEREVDALITGRDMVARTEGGKEGEPPPALDWEGVRQIVAESGADAESRLAELGFTEAGAARVAGYLRQEAALTQRMVRVLGDIRDRLARDTDAGADPHRAEQQRRAVRAMKDLQPLRTVYQRAGTRGAAAKAFRAMKFTDKQANDLADAFDEERRLAVSPMAASAWKAAYLSGDRSLSPAERLKRMTGFEAAPAPEHGPGAQILTLRGSDGQKRGEILFRPDSAVAFDPESAHAAEAVEQFTGGLVAAAEWRALTPEERAQKTREHGFVAAGGFTVTDPADPSVEATGAQADILTGRIDLAPDAPSAELYHEAAHAWLAAFRRAGKLTDADVARLREAYGPSPTDPAWFNEEKFADDIKEIGAETDYGSDHGGRFPLARRFVSAVRRFAGAARAGEARRAAASGARQAIFENIVYGRAFEGVGDFAAVPAASVDGKAGKDSPLAGASTAPGAAETPETRNPKPETPETRNQKPETPETRNQKPETPAWAAATPQGNIRVGGRWVLLPRDRFISDTDPRYDFSLQNRSRDAALGSSEQVASIVANFDALRLLDAPDTAAGAPVAVPVTIDGKEYYMVLSGNGRFRALDALEADHRGDLYRKPVQAFADERGIPYDAAHMTAEARPRLVRVLTRRPVGVTLQRLAELSNQNTVLQMTDAERAYSDAALIERDGTAGLFAANKDGMPSRSGSDEFFSWFVRAAGDASLLDSRGRPTDAARARARRAMLALAVGRGRRGKETVMAFTEQAESLGLERQRDALLMSAGTLTALGESKPEYALADEISRAAADLLMLARERKGGKAVTVDAFIGQGDMLDAMPPAAAEALRLLDSARPAEGIAEAFRRYADLASKIDTATDDMFGEPPAAAADLLRKAAADTEVNAPAEDAEYMRAVKIDGRSPDIRYSLQARRLEPYALPDSLAEVSAGTSVAALAQSKFKAEHARHRELRAAGDWAAARSYARGLAADGGTRLLGNYLLAKYHGDAAAAKAVVERWAKPEEAEKIRERIGDTGLLKPIVFAPTMQREGDRFNALPAVYAQWLAQKINGVVSPGFRKVAGSGAPNTGAAVADRVNRDYAFEGGEGIGGASPVILVDDVWTSGQTLWTVYEHLKTVNPSAHVAAFATLASGRYGKNVRPTAKQLTAFWEKSNLTSKSFKERLGNGIEKLTGSEIQAYILTGGRGPDAAAAFFGGGTRAARGADAGDSRAVRLRSGSGEAGLVDAPVRYALDLTGGSYSKENLIVGYMAHADLTGGPFPSRARVAALADAIGLERHRYNDLAERARALSASTVDDAIRRAAASAAPDAAAFAIGELARAAERALVRAGAAGGARLARSGERIRSLAESGVAAAMRAVTGADYADLQTDTGIDLAASLLAADPKSFGPEEARKRDEAAGAILPDPFTGEDSERVETDEDAPELTDAQRAEIARKRRERESRVQAMLDAAAARAATNRARDEERRRRREAAALADAEDTAGSGEAGADAASGGDAPADPVADALAADTAAPIDLSDRWLAAAILRVWAFARFRRENPLRHDTRGDLTKNRVAVEFYRKTAVRQLTDLARKLLEPGAPRESIRAHIADIAPHLTANQIERRTAFIFGLINRHAIRESRRGLVRKFRAQIKRQFVKGEEFEELGVDIDRTLTGAVEEDARYVMRVCELSDKALDGEPSALEKERARIEAVIAEREGMTDEHGNPLAVGGDDMQLRRALRQLALLDKYGAMVDMMPGEILDLTGEALASLGREALDLAARWEEYDRLVKRIKDPIVRSVSRKPTDPKAADSTLNKAADSTLSMLRQRLDWLTRYEGDPSKREEARAAISDLMNLLAEGHTGYVTARADDRAALMKALGEIFKKPDGRPDRRAIRAYLRRLDEKIPRALAGQLTRQGNQASMTYGQMLHLLAYLDQWASYSDNIIRHDRRGQAALIRSFTYEDPKTGEVRRALTSEDTQLLEWLRRAHYAGKRDVISNVMVRLCGREVESPDPLYHPVRMLQERRASLAAAARVSSWQPLAGVFSRRRKHRLDVDESASILDMFENRSHETAVLTAFGETGLVIREVLTSRAFQDAVRRFHGEKTLSRILRQVAQSLDGGRAQGGGQSAAASLAQRVSTYMYLGFNLHSASKQTASLPVFAARMGFRKLGSILFSPIDRDAVRTLREADHHRARYGTGPASGMSAADREAYSGYDTSPLRRFFGDWGLAPTRWADEFVSLWVGQGVYRDYLAQYLDMGMSREDAERRAISETYSLIEETQQSGRAENLPEMSREHGFLGRLMVQFATSPLQQMQYEIKEFAEWRDLVNNGGPEASIREARNKFMRAAFINHILVPGMMAAISNAFKLATGDEPDWERDGFLGELMIAAIMGQFGRIFFAGALTEQTLRVLFLRKPPYMGQLVPAEGMIRFAGNLAYPVRDIITWDTEHFRGDIMRLLKSIALTRVPARIYERATEGE
ncbi:MAG: hypothetical protein PHG74_02675 [Kiritimatiellae bacterium]|nr:hypothetical protein [Kiritimatiellia bacterium]